MVPSNPNSPEILRREILAEARRESEEILQKARQEAEALLARAAAEAEQIRGESLEQARAEAARRQELILATVAVEAGRLRSARMEFWLQTIHQAACEKLQARQGFDYREAILALAVEALSRMTGDAFVVKLPPSECGTLGNGLAEEIRRHVGRPLTVSIVAEPAVKDGGLIIQDHEGRQIWDNRFPSRLERLWPELRRQIAVGTSLVARSGAAGGDP